MEEQVLAIIESQGWDKWDGSIDDLKKDISSKCDTTCYFTVLELLHIDQRDPNKPHELAVANPFFGHPNQTYAFRRDIPTIAGSVWKKT